MTVQIVHPTKRCSQCDEEKPLAEFYKLETGRDGRSPLCKSCAREYQKTRRAARREEMGEEAWLALQREIVAKSRASTKRRTGTTRTPGGDAYMAAERRLRERHRQEFDALLREERYERGLEVGP